MNTLLNAEQTAQALPYPLLALEIAALLQDPAVQVPPRIVQALQGGGSLFVMPATDARVAITKLISFIPGNAARGLPTIQGDIVVFDVATGQRIGLMDGPTVTARRTAAEKHAQTAAEIGASLAGASPAVQAMAKIQTGTNPADMTDAEIAAVLSYIRSDWGNKAPDITADTVKAQREATKARTASL